MVGTDFFGGAAGRKNALLRRWLPGRSGLVGPLSTHQPRKLKRLYDQRGKIIKALTKEYFAHNVGVKMLDGSEPLKL